jgi:hypothetical protein
LFFTRLQPAIIVPTRDLEILEASHEPDFRDAAFAPLQWAIRKELCQPPYFTLQP